MTLNPIKWYKSIKALFKIKSEVSKMSLNEIKTSEGRLTLLLNIIAVYGAVQGFLPAALVAKIAVISVAAYAIARALVKAAGEIAKVTKSTKDDVIVAEAEKVLDAVAPKPK